MNEISMLFGSERHMLGTVTLPQDANARSVGFLVLNAGVIHRVGPHRWHVKLAREMARRGFPAMRFDPSGLGDSRVPRQAAAFQEQAVIDIRAAMDQLGDLTGAKRFVIGGICSGAENGFQAALADPRVVGVWMLDGYAFPTARTRTRRYTLKLQSMPAREVLASAARKLGQLAGRGRAPAAEAAPVAAPEPAASGPSAREFAGALQSLVDRGVGTYLVYSGSVIHRYNYDAQFREAFAGERFLDVVRCDYRPDIDHTVTTLQCQATLTALVADWCGALPAVAAAEA